MRNCPINRGDDIYKEIESFEDYELDKCVAYEMAIRVDEVIKIFDNYMMIKGDSFFSSDDKNFFNLGIKLEEYGIYGLGLIYYLSKSIGLDITFNRGKLHTTHTGELLCEDVGGICHIEKEGIFCYDREGKIVFIKKEKIDTSYKPTINLTISRPLLKFKKTKIFNFNLNLNLSKNEFMAYMEKLKDVYDEDNSAAKTPLELLGDSLERANDEISITRPRGKNEVFNVRQHLNNNDKYADMFFIYDAYKVGMKQRDIIQSINDYYYDKYEKKTYIDPKTINKYNAIAKEYIDNLKYKELVTGIKQ